MRGDRVGGPIRWRMHIPVPPEEVFAVLDNDYACRSKVLERRLPHLLSIDYLVADKL